MRNVLNTYVDKVAGFEGAATRGTVIPASSVVLRELELVQDLANVCEAREAGWY